MQELQTTDAKRAKERDWHAHETSNVLDALSANAYGQSHDEARRRHLSHGPNRLPEGKQRGALARLMSQFHNVLIYVLLAAALLAFSLGAKIDAGVILGVVFLNAVIGFVQEGRAEQALNAIRDMISAHASVIREGKRLTVAADELVPGDIVIIEAGDQVPADLRLIEARRLKIDEAALTGESVAVDKGTAPVAPGAALGDRSSMAFSGTFVAKGQGVGVAVGIGSNTELGRISGLLDRVETLKTPLIRQMDSFARLLTAIILVVSVATFLFAYFVRAYPLTEAFMAVVGLAVAAIPEGLPAVMTIALAIGVKRMADRNAIIRRLPAVETLGSVSVICSDKTGTLTRNEMTARTVVTADGSYQVEGHGYAPEGAFHAGDGAVDPAGETMLGQVVRAGLLCNDAEVREKGGTWVAEGDPMEGALVSLAMKAGQDPVRSRSHAPRTEEIPFDAEHRFMATLHHDKDGNAFILVKGAPERVFDMCTRERYRDGERPIDRDSWSERAEERARHGERILAFAAKPVTPGHQRLAVDDVVDGAVLLGFVGFVDPARNEAVDAVADCHSAGIRVIMITGDHALTAREIARDLGIAEAPKVLTGADLDRLDADGLSRAALEGDVFARTTPEHKLRLVEALQANRLTVAMTGDGVNDAPALKRADIGVAMGLKGTEVAKQAAEMVLGDDNFASIVAAVREGRTVYDNIMKVIEWTLPTTCGAAVTIIFAIAFGLALPLLPVQLLWINMVTVVALGLTLAFEPTEPGAMKRPPRRSDRPILDLRLAWQIGFVSAIFVAGSFGAYEWSLSRGASVEEARTLVVNVMVTMQILYLFSVRYVRGHAWTIERLFGTWMVHLGVAVTAVCQIAFTYLPAMQFVFRTEGLGIEPWLVVFGIGAGMLTVVEIEKTVRRHLAQTADW